VIARRGALEALERVLNRGGPADEVLEEVVGVLGRLYDRVAIRLVRDGELVSGPSRGNPAGTASAWPVHSGGARVGEIEVAPADEEDDVFMRRVATLVSPYFR
jgi:hypothetical protein